MSGRSAISRLGWGSNPVWHTSSGSAPADVPSPTNERQRGAPPTSSLPKTRVAQRRPSSWHTAQPAKSSSPSPSDGAAAAAATPARAASSIIHGSRQTNEGEGDIQSPCEAGVMPTALITALVAGARVCHAPRRQLTSSSGLQLSRCLELVSYTDHTCTPLDVQVRVRGVLLSPAPP